MNGYLGVLIFMGAALGLIALIIAAEAFDLWLADRRRQRSQNADWLAEHIVDTTHTAGRRKWQR